MSLKVIMKNKKGEILGLKALDRGTLRGYYDFPGGRIDTDEFFESFENIIHREIQEEVGDISYTLNPRPVALGRHVTPAAFTSTGFENRIIYIFFEAQYHGGAIRVNHEHMGFLWIDASQIKLEDYFISGILEGIQQYLGRK